MSCRVSFADMYFKIIMFIEHLPIYDRPCSKSSGSSSPLRVVSGVDIDMVMSGAMDLGLHRTMFISVCDEILWDRENEVWDDVISRFDQISLSPQVSMDSMGEEG